MPNPLLLDPTILVQLLVLGVLLGGIYATVSVGLTIIFGVMDVVNIAHAAFVAVGMYTVWAFAQHGLSPFLAIPAAAALMFGAGVVIQRSTIAPLIDERQSSRLLVTIAISIVIIAVIEATFGPTPRHLDLDLGSIAVGRVYIIRGQLYALVVAAVAFGAVWLLLHRTHTGRAIRGTADSRVNAAYAGVDVERVDAITFGLGAGLAGLAGALVTFVQPFDPYLGNTYLTIAFVVVVLGGLGSVSGTAVGGLVVGLLHVFGSYYLPGTYYNVLILVVFVALLAFRPTGLFGGAVDE
jgi:branched-chain amino acid transport system permease protein